MRSVADQSDVELGGTWSILVRQKRDHVVLDRLLDRVVSVSGAEQEAVLHQIARLVFPHAFAEEAVLWPALRRTDRTGEGLTLRVEQEHQEVNELWRRLEGDDLPFAERDPVVARLVEVLREDVRDEEDRLLPRLQNRLGPGRLRLLGLTWEVVRRTAPTRPHPEVSRRPPGNALSALPLSVLDRTRDRVEVAARAPGPSGARARALSQTLRRCAERVERLGILRRGEHPSTRTR